MPKKGPFNPERVKETVKEILRLLLPRLKKNQIDNFLKIVLENVNINNLGRKNSHISLNKRNIRLAYFPRNQNENKRGKGPRLEITGEKEKITNKLKPANLPITISEGDIITIYFQKGYHL